MNDKATEILPARRNNRNMARHLRRGCELRFGFSILARPCRQPSVGLCQYCGREFCADHGTRNDDGQEVCQRAICQKKTADLEAHARYREAARVLNAWERCGVDGCQGALWGQCSGCQAIYCLDHLHDRTRSAWSNGIRIEVPASLCDHCSARSHIWRYR